MKFRNTFDGLSEEADYELLEKRENDITEQENRSTDNSVPCGIKTNMCQLNSLACEVCCLPEAQLGCDLTTSNTYQIQLSLTANPCGDKLYCQYHV